MRKPDNSVIFKGGKTEYVKPHVWLIEDEYLKDSEGGFVLDEVEYRFYAP
jgi:hypothetical protein